LASFVEEENQERCQEIEGATQQEDVAESDESLQLKQANETIATLRQQLTQLQQEISQLFSGLFLAALHLTTRGAAWRYIITVVFVYPSVRR